MAIALGGIAVPGLAQQSANNDDARRAFATHDYTTTTGSATTLDERWVDVKTPGDLDAGDARSYVVGTIEVTVTGGNASFSGSLVGVPTSGWSSISNALTQVGILQCRDAGENILWQRHFYGWNTASSSSRWTNLRAVAVWPTDDESETRIVICGETADTELPFGTTLSSATTTDPTGFLAVFNGAGTLLWTQRFYGHDFSKRCAITDVAIRVEEIESVTYDVVTYCGVSTHGNPNSGTPLTPLLPFAAPIVASPNPDSYTPASGSTNAGAGYWDGIVGRVRFDRGNSTISRDFHSIVGGSEADGLFGLALLDADRFVVVGNTMRLSSSASAEAFPFTRPGVDDGGNSTDDWNNASAIGDHPNYCVGTLTMFDASGTRNSQNLTLQASVPLGHVGGDESLARDVWAAPFHEQFSIFVVGSTDDDDTNDDFIASLPSCSRGFQGTHGGLDDGFLVQAVTTSTPALSLQIATFVGGSANDGLTGVSGWNEMPLNCAVCGFQDNGGAGSGIDLLASSFWNWTADRLRSDVPGSSSNDVVTALGTSHAMTASLAYPTGLGEPAGGGISVDSRLRASVVGASPSAGATTSFPVVGGLSALGGIDAVRVVYDMLPQGVWRTDGTGTRASGFGSVPQPSGYYGGATPMGCLAPFGQLPGTSAPELRRVGIDYSGPAPAGGVTTGVVRVTDFDLGLNQYIIGLIQVGFPSTGPSTLFSSQAEIWAFQNPAVLYAGYSSFQWSLGTLPSGANEFTVQGVFLLPSPMSCDSGASTGTVASPGLVISY